MTEFGEVNVTYGPRSGVECPNCGRIVEVPAIVGKTECADIEGLPYGCGTEFEYEIVAKTEITNEE